ncbi:MAG TPA: type IV pilus twitching motility protein PilT [Armatimonadota bacterium]|nr:type IV pilus twitching motility protein PilT [Armatimonadota bacterium]
MPFVDKIIQYLQSQQGERIVLENDQPCMIYRPGGVGAPTKDRLSLSQICNLVNEILPDSHRLDYSSGQPITFEYAYGAGTMEIAVTQTDGNVRVSVGVPDSREAPIAHSENGSHQPAEPTYAGPEKPISHMDELFRLLRDIEGSDLHLTSREKPMVRIHGKMKKLDQFQVSDPDELKRILWEITPQRNQEEWERDHDTDFAYELAGVARFRCNIFADRHGPGAVFRLIPSKIATAKDLNLTQSMLDLCFLSKGLVVVTGPTGSGKSTTLAALVDHINKHRDEHIITIEDPVEFVHNNINCLVNQREVHVHTNSFSRALRAALREDPDIVLVGEMRDLETVAIAIETAETGHLVFGTLHTTTAATTVDRIIDQFPADQQEQIRTMLSEALKAVIAQTLCRSKDGRRVAAFEILLVDPAAANLIREGKTYQLPSMMQIGKNRGCITMNDSLFTHVKEGRVDPKEAYLKSVDKVGLLGMFEKENIKLDISHAL